MYKKILNERLGVPKGIVETSKRIYSDVLDNLLKILSVNKNKYEFTINPTPPYQFEDFIIKIFNMNITLYKTQNVTEVEVMEMGVKSSVRKELSGERPHFYVKEKEFTSSMSLKLIVPIEWDKNMVKKYFIDNQVKIISSFAHELKHEYDEFKKNRININQRIDYIVSKQMIGSVPPIQEFSFFLYFTSNIESLVRPTEVYTELELMGITKKEFLNFLLKNRTFLMLKEIQDFSFVDFKEQLLTYLYKIEEIFDENDIQYNNMTDEEKVNYFLKLYVFSFLDEKNSYYNELISSNIMEEIFGFSGKKEMWGQNFQKKMLKYVNNYEKFFEDSERMFKFVSTNMIKKISKLYDMLNGEITESSIYNPKLYSIINKNNEKLMKNIKEMMLTSHFLKNGDSTK
jgi:hypothetical protein